jgi:electron transport complex protein RnfD
MNKENLEHFDYAIEISDTPPNTVPLPEPPPATASGSAESAAKSAVKEKDKPSRIYFEQLLCLLLIGGVAYWGAGARLILMVIFSLLGAVAMDMIGCALTKKEYNPRDFSTLTAGMCIALLMPAGAAYPLAFFGSALTIAVKHIFGGKNNYIFNPTAVAFAFLILCYPGQMLLFPRPLERLPIWGEIDPALLTRLTPLDGVPSFDILMGNITGSMGTVHILVILVSGFCLLLRRSISAVVTLTALFTNLLLAGVSASESGTVHAALTVLVSGSFLFILVFLANDPQTLPKTFLGKVYYGLMFGSAVPLFRHFGKVEGYPVFALLFVNTMGQRTDILARRTVVLVKRAIVAAKNRLGSYERIQDKVENEVDVPLLATTAMTSAGAISTALVADSHEGDLLDNIQYNMPPIDNKIIKFNRKKPSLIARFKEKLRNLTEKRDFSQTGASSQSSSGEINFLENLRAGLKDIGARFKKSEKPEPPPAPEIEPIQELTPLELSILIDDNDVIEVEVEGEAKPPKQDKRKKKSHVKK